MLLEDLVSDLHRPLTTLKFINDVLEEKLYNDWDFFKKETCKDAENLLSMILINRRLIKYLLILRQKYSKIIERTYHQTKQKI